MAETPEKSSIHIIRRQIAETEERLVQQRKVVAERVANDQHEAVLMGIRVLRTMETTLSLLRNHLELDEQRRQDTPHFTHDRTSTRQCRQTLDRRR